MANSKPSLFIGSSVEGLNIAYAAQQNLQHSAEVTVWDQGVFNLSVSALDSLLRVLDTCDFAMFVFSPDDIVNIRGVKNQAIRDNVVFELGLFVGKLGKERCFILMPDKNNKIRIPTDLIGMTPATYETGRRDNSYQAATGPACHMIRKEIIDRGVVNLEVQNPSVNQENEDFSLGNLIEKEKDKDKDDVIANDEIINKETTWLDAFIEDKYDLCIKLLNEKIQKEKDEIEISDLESWKGRAIFREDRENGISYLHRVIKKYPNEESPYIHLAYGLKEIYEYDMCLEIVNDGIRAVEEPIQLIKAKCSCLEELGLDDQIEVLLTDYTAEFPKNPTLAITLSDYYIDKKNYVMARATLETVLKTNQKNKDILKKYASLLYDHFDKKLALLQYNKLIDLDSNNSEFITLRANIYLQLDLNDLAMSDYKKANEIAKGKQEWILSNIGNLYKNRGFYREAITYLKKGIEISPESEYAHNRLSEAIKKRDEENKKLDEIIKEARKSLASTALINKSNNTATPVEPVSA